MADAALFRRTTAATGLVGSAVLAAAATLIYQPTGGGVPADVLAGLQRAPGPAEISAILFVLQGFASVIAALAIGHLLRGRFPLLSSVGVGLAAVGGFASPSPRRSPSRSSRWPGTRLTTARISG